MDRYFGTRSYYWKRFAFGFGTAGFFNSSFLVPAGIYFSVIQSSPRTNDIPSAYLTAMGLDCIGDRVGDCYFTFREFWFWLYASAMGTAESYTW